MAFPPGQPPLMDGITEPEESSLHRLTVGQIGRDRRSEKPRPSSRRLVSDIVKMLEMLMDLDPRLADRASRAIDELTGRSEKSGAYRFTDVRAGGGGSVKTPI